MTALISVITPTWNRSGETLRRCLDSVAAQGYRRWEHIVVSDGPDAEFFALAKGHRDPRVKFLAMEEHYGWSRWGVDARVRGLEDAQGEMVAWLDDDNCFRPPHLELLSERITDSGADWGYSQCLFQHHGAAANGYVIGGEPPALGSLDTSAMMSKRSLYETVTWRDDGQQTIDWDLAERWMAKGYSWAFLPAVTVDYFISPLPAGGPRMAKWHVTMAGDCPDEKLAELPQALANATEAFGMFASQMTSDMHNGPLPEPKKARRSGKAADDPDA